MSADGTEHSAGAVVVDGGRVLILLDHAGLAVLPKGHVEPGEIEEEAAAREVREETGLMVESGRRLGEVHHGVLEEPEKRKLVTYFLARVVGEPMIQLDEPHASARWVPIGELGRLNLKYSEDRAVLNEVALLDKCRRGILNSSEIRGKFKGEMDRVPIAVWLVARYQIDLEGALKRVPETTLGHWHKLFERDEGLTPGMFTAVNHGTVLMWLYGLLVLPREHWSVELKNTKDTGPVGLPQGFEIATAKPLTGDPIRRIRNAVAHANVGFDPSTQKFFFWDHPPGATEVGFLAVAGTHEVLQLIETVAKYMVNVVSRQTPPRTPP